VLQEENGRRRALALEAAGRYLGASPGSIAFTESTTMGLGLVYNGLRLSPGQEILTTEHGYYVTHESLRLASIRTGAVIRQIRLFPDPQNATADEIVSAIAEAILPATRVLALTWVHSGTGLKLPLAEIGKVVAEANAGREEENRILLCVDGVHGFGVEDFTLATLRCDFFVAGCHKWLFGPRRLRLP
jgi:isopenicillin-N epimerase